MPRRYHLGMEIDPEEYLREHFTYEVEMLVGTAERLIFPARGTDAVVRNALLESFLIHVRCLDSFLSGYGARATDVTARKLLGWADSGSEMSTIREAINKTVAHLTTGRVDRLHFNVAETARMMADRVAGFIQACPTEFHHVLGRARAAAESVTMTALPESTTATSGDVVVEM